MDSYHTMFQAAMRCTHVSTTMTVVFPVAAGAFIYLVLVRPQDGLFLLFTRIAEFDRVV